MDIWSGLARIRRSINIRLLPGRLFYPPEWLVLGVNGVCNLKCRMCDMGTHFSESNFYRNMAGAADPADMPLDLINRIITQAAQYYPGAKLGYAFTEPLLYPHLMPSLKYAGDSGLYTALTTNALNLKDLAEDLAVAGLNELFISLDGPPEIHNEIRGHPRSFQRAMEGIDKFRDLGKRPDLSVFCVITPWNTGYLKTFADIFRGLPLKELCFMHPNYTTRQMADWHNKTNGDRYPATSTCLDKMDIGGLNLDVLYQDIRHVQQTVYPFPVTFSPAIRTREALSVFYTEPEIFFGKFCLDAFRNIMIRTDGSVIPAHCRCYALSVGNMHRQTLKDVWNAPALARFRKDLMKAGGFFPACARCCSAF